jgi:hypothetical protein
MKTLVARVVLVVAVLVALFGGALRIVRSSQADQGGRGSPSDAAVERDLRDAAREGRTTFRFDTFGDEDFWGGTLQLHRAIEGSGFGGVGDGVSPATALAVGLKVDVDLLPGDLIRDLRRARVNLNDPGVTLQLLRLNAVLGLTGFFNPDGSLKSMGIQCALCHSTVDASLAPGIGHRLDGWANRDLNVGAIVALAPNLEPVAGLLHVSVATLRSVLNAWGPGKFDAEVFLDGKALRPDGKPGTTLIPPAFGLAGVNLHTWTGWGSVTHWNAFVANLEMHGKGTFYDPRLADAAQFPIAAANGFFNVRTTPDLITPKLAALHIYQLALKAPKAPERSFDPAAAARGARLFGGTARCATCHVPPLYTEPGWNMHTPAEIGVDDFQSSRAPDRRYRTAPLKGLWTHEKGGFYHDGRFATLREVVVHYNGVFNLGLREDEIQELVQFLRSI